ncbi:MAG: putative transcriptional regulator, LuxR family [Glaciihabitans sp.]|nr:putative transcriptional regulator, LuxR family [Glaciihabitans sp.]
MVQQDISTRANSGGGHTQLTNSTVGYGRDHGYSADVLAGGGSIVLFGAAGLGKSFFAEAITTELRARGLAPLKIRGSRYTQSTQLGALQAAYGSAVTGDATSTPSVGPAQLLQWARTQSGAQRPIIAVDDAQLLDPLSAELLTRLAEDRAISLLLTASPAMVRSMDAQAAQTFQYLTTLWVQGGAHRVDLEPLSRAEAKEFLAVMAPEVTFDTATRLSLFIRSAGSPLLLRELASEAVKHRLPLEDREITASTVLSPVDRIQHLLSDQLAALSPTQLNGLAVLGRLSTVPHALCLAVLSATDVRALLDRGFLRRENTGRPREGDDVVVVHAVYAEAAVALGDPEAVDALADTLAEAILARYSGVRSLTDVECLLISESWASAADLAQQSERWGHSTVADVLGGAARHLNRTGHNGAAEALARRATTSAPSVTGFIELSVAVAARKDFGRALDVLAEAADTLSDPREAVQLVRWWAALANRQAVSPYELETLAERAASWFPGVCAVEGEIELVRLAVLNRGLNRALVAETAAGIALRQELAPLVRARALAIAALEYSLLGNSTSAVELTRRLVSLMEEMPTSLTTVDDADERISSIVFLAITAVHRVTGATFGDLDAELEQRIERQLRTKNYYNLGVLALAAGYINAQRGHLETARAEHEAAVIRFRRHDPEGNLAWSEALFAVATAETGMVQEALLVAREAVVSARELGDHLWTKYLIDHQRAEITPREYDDDAQSGGEDAPTGGTAGVMQASRLYGRFVAGEDAGSLVVAMEAAAAGLDLPPIRAAVRHIRAVADGSPADLDEVAAQFAELGDFGHARVASEDAARLHKEQGDRPAALLSRIRASAYSERAQGMSATVPSPVPQTEPLTARENEIAVLAARGLSNRAIARDLFLSVRTVESHLYQARIKLGSVSRRDLGAALRSASRL